jgi:anti-sigma B factor antagonist
MNLHYEKKDNIIIVYVSSPLDIGNSPLIQRDISTLINQFPDYNFILNMERVEFMNSAGLGVLIISTKRLESNNKCLKISNLNIAVKKVIQILDAHEIINVYDTEDEAVKSFELCG